MDALEVLSQQHRHIDQLFDELLNCEVDQRIACFKRLAGALTQHAILEATHLYPALRHHGAEEEVNEALKAHEDVKYRLENVCSYESEDQGFRDCIEGLRGQINSHVGEEEENLFALAREKLGAQALQQMEHDMRGTLRLWEEYEPPARREPATPWLQEESVSP